MININKKTAMNKFKFSDIATISTQKKKPTDEDKFHYIGLEHLDSKSLKVTRYGADVAPKGEKLVMKKGDVLFGKRRAYQKKVAIAPFDGIFSAHGMILRPNEKVISRELFPFFISSDAFLDKAIKISVGSLSPTINNSDIKKLEFELPDIREQEKYSNALFAINDTKEAYINLIGNLDKIQKSRFIELFGDPFLIDEKEKVPFKNAIAETVKGPFGSDMKKSLFVPKSDTTYKVFSQVNAIQKDATAGDYYISAEYYEKMKRFTVNSGDYIVTCDGTLGKIYCLPENIEKGVISSSLLRIALNKDVISNVYFETIWNMYMLPMLVRRSRNACLVHLPSAKDIGNLPVPIPNIDKQRDYDKFSNQIDKSKFNLKCAITELDNLSDKIKSEIFS